jgi:hypothetical protein
MPNGNLKHLVNCPSCHQDRLVRSDVIKRLADQSKPMICKPCHNRQRFELHDHPKKGTGVKNDPVLKSTRNSYYKAKRRCKMGEKHHACYENVEFKFTSLQQLIDCIGVREEGMTLDRINPLGNYESGNVRWATIAEQAKNRMPRGYWKKTKQD